MTTKELDKIRIAATKMQKALVSVSGLVAEIERFQAVERDLTETARLRFRAGELKERKDIAAYIRSQMKSAAESEMPLTDALEILANVIELGEYKDKPDDQG